MRKGREHDLQERQERSWSQMEIQHKFSWFFLLGGAAPTLSWGRKGGTPARSWLGIVRATGPDPLRHCSRRNTHLHYMPLCLSLIHI